MHKKPKSTSPRFADKLPARIHFLKKIDAIFFAVQTQVKF